MSHLTLVPEPKVRRTAVPILPLLTKKRVQAVLARVDTVTDPNGCWRWMGTAGPDRQGNLRGRFTLGNEPVLASRLMWTIANQADPVGQIDHLDGVCVTKLCVRPDHLEDVSATENCRRSALFLHPVCPAGHPTDPANPLSDIYIQVNDKGHRRRYCRPCHRKHTAESKARKRAADKAAKRAAYLAQVAAGPQVNRNVPARPRPAI